jgi:uncharacterized alpha-E superfamily protein
MLSRTAENLFWMARYMERAECTARLLTMGQRMAILPGATMRDEWRSVALVTECEHVFGKDAVIRESDIVEHLMLNPDNPASIRSCLAKARQNAKSVRTALTQEMWEALNEGWRKLETYGVVDARRDFAELIDWVKNRAMIFRGATESGHLRNEGHDFLRVGGALERAQMTLRLLDVKYYVLLPETEVVGGHRDHYQWSSVLHALSGSRAYHHVYGGSDHRFHHAQPPVSPQRALLLRSARLSPAAPRPLARPAHASESAQRGDGRGLVQGEQRRHFQKGSARDDPEQTRPVQRPWPRNCRSLSFRLR